MEGFIYHTFIFDILRVLTGLNRMSGVRQGSVPVTVVFWLVLYFTTVCDLKSSHINLLKPESVSV